MEKRCEFCKALRPAVYCKSDAAHLCPSCDAKVHSANALSSRHPRTLICDSCILEFSVETRNGAPEHLLIRIESCSSLSANGIEKYESREFVAGDHKWKLTIYPNAPKVIPPKSQITADCIHESGHAIVALNTEGAHPIHKATIMPRGSALGMVTQLPSDDETSISKKQLLAVSMFLWEEEYLKSLSLTKIMLLLVQVVISTQLESLPFIWYQVVG